MKKLDKTEHLWRLPSKRAQYHSNLNQSQWLVKFSRRLIEIYINP